MWQCQVSSWLGGRLLALSVPVLGGRITAKADQDVPEQISFTVPRYAAPADGQPVIDWRPTGPGDPLARYGQQLDVTITVSAVSTAQTWSTRVGRFLITDWSDDDAGTITVTGAGMLQVVKDAKLTSPSSPSGSLMSETRRLLPSGMGVSFDATLVDRSCPTSMAWAEDRLVALKDIAAAWPALLRTDEWGQVRFKAPLPSVPTPALTLTDGVGGTVVTAPRADSRTDAYNVVVATSKASGRADLQGIATIASGPMAANGPYFPVVKKWSSPLLDTQSAAQAAAQTMLENSMRPARTIPVTIASDPRIDLDDPVAIQRGSDAPLWGWVTGYDMPLTAMDGVMRVDVGVPG
jgi:hypothetical protein